MKTFLINASLALVAIACVQADVDLSGAAEPVAPPPGAYYDNPGDDSADDTPPPDQPPPDPNADQPPDDQSEPLPSQLPADAGGALRGDIAGLATQILLGQEHGVVFYAFDTLAYPREDAALVAQVRSGGDLGGIPGVSVGFFLGRKQVGSAITDRYGYATFKWRPPKVGYYQFEARILASPDRLSDSPMLKVRPGPLLVACHDKKTRFVVVDLDQTLVASGFAQVLLGQPQPMLDSPEVMKRIATRYCVVYLTSRPDLLTARSKAWLTTNGFPKGPLLVTHVGELIEGNWRFKSTRLAALRKAFANVDVGIGDKTSDALAYADNGMKAYLIPRYKDKAKDIRKKAVEIRILRGEKGVQVVDNWRQIEQSIFEGKEYSVERYLKLMDRRLEQARDREYEEEEYDD